MKRKKKQKLECEKCQSTNILTRHSLNLRTGEINFIKPRFRCIKCRHEWDEPVKKEGKKILIKPYPSSGTTAKSFHTLISPKKPVKVNLI